MTISGRAQVFGEQVNTDAIIAAQYKAASLDMAEIAQHTFADLDPTFVERVRPGDLIVAGKNFGCGSSRETAVHVLRHCGIAAVLAPTFARIFFRNAINNGLLVLECDTDGIEQDDTVELDLDHGRVEVTSRGIVRSVAPLPAIMQELVKAGGLASYLRTYGDFRLPEETLTT